MSRLILLCALLQILATSIAGEAPSDFEDSCVNPTNFRIIPPTVGDNECILMHSNYYTRLLGSGGVWTALDADPNGITWSHGRGGICTYQVRSCSVRGRSPQMNYLITQFIRLETINEVQIELSYSFSNGNFQRALDVLYYEADTADAPSSTDIGNYKVLVSFSPTADMYNGLLSASFKPTGKKGFYLAVRENGTCITLTYVKVYSYCCKAQKIGLVTYPLTIAPAQDSTTPALGEGQCAEKSSVQETTGSLAQCQAKNSSTSLSPIEVQCLQSGKWDESRDCHCEPGYSLGDGSQCTACSADTYKSTYSNVDSCLSCPLNSASDQGSSCCICKRGFYRTADELPSVPCTASPSKPLNVQLVEEDSYSLSITFDAPLDNGGRSDLSYSIEYQESSMSFRGYISAGVIELRTFTLDGLKPVTEYTIRVTAENGVSDQDPDSREGRTAVITGTTTEGVPGKIDIFQNTRGNTFSWQPPAEANGVIIGFVCRIFREGEAVVENKIKLGPFEFCFTPVPENIPPGSGPVMMQVAAETAVGVGELSDPLPLEIETQKSCPILSSPSNGEVIVISSLVGGVARYFCGNGFNLIGNPSRVCQADETWSENTPTCELVSCSPLSEPSNALVVLSDGTDLNSIAEYRCMEGYEPVGGDSLRFCQLDGTWTGEELVCGPAPTPACPPCATPLPLTMSCPPTVTCNSCPPCPPPTCPPPTECPEVTCPTSELNTLECSQLEPIENGALIHTSSSVGSMVTYSCNSGYTLVGGSVRECQLTSAWTGSAPSCEVRTCEELPNPDNGAVAYDSRSVGSVARYTCNAGFSIPGSASRLCQSNGEWSGREFTCFKDCESLEDVENGQLTVTGLSSGAVAIYTCNTPYTLEGDSFRQCSNGEWTGTRPTCHAPMCEHVGEEYSLCASSCRPTCENPTPFCFTVCSPGCTCPPGLILDESQSRCINVNDCPSDVTFELNGTTYVNGSSVALGDIGERNSALLFRTDYSNCCQAQRAGECYRPDGALVGVRASQDQLYRNRGTRVIRLNHQSRFNEAADPGLYCCDVPISENEVKRVCVDITP